MRLESTTSARRIAVLLASISIIAFVLSVLFVSRNFSTPIEPRTVLKLFLISVQFVLFATAVLFGPILWVRTIVNLFRMAAERRPELSKEHFRHIRWVPLKIYFYPELLTTLGLESRSKFNHSVLWFIALISSVFTWEFLFEPLST